VCGFVRLSIQKPLPLCSAQQRGCALRIVDPERDAVIVFEVRFGEIAVQVRLANVMELAVDGALETTQ
jgi:hypothetical protein